MLIHNNQTQVQTPMIKIIRRRHHFHEGQNWNYCKKSSEDSVEDKELDDHHRLYTTYCTITVKMPKDNDFIKFLHAKYAILLDILLQADDKLFVNQ